MNKIIFIGILFAPAIVFGAGTVQSVVAITGRIMEMLASISLVFAMVAFFYGIALYILNVNNEEKMKEGKSWMFWSVIALFVMITIWGIIALLQKTVGSTQGPGKVDIIVPKL
jgi:hypothetical protein